MAGNKELFPDYQEKQGGGSVRFRDDRKGQIKRYGVIVKGDFDITRLYMLMGSSII